MSPKYGPIELRDRLAELLTLVEREPRMLAELERAKREFFGAGFAQLTSADLEAPLPALEVRAIRFAEWFLCERPSDFLGAVPVDVALTRFAPPLDCEALQDSVVGVFLVQSTTPPGGPTVRDVADNEVFELSEVPGKLSVGDVLIGRLFATTGEGGPSVPSIAMSILSASPHFAIAYQRDLRELGLDRRLTQAEIEHLVFHDRGRVGQREAEASGPAPLEHIEAQLASLLAAGGADERSAYRATAISDALRSAENPFPVVDALLTELAFDTAVDIDATRRVLLEMIESARMGDPYVDSAQVERDADAAARAADADDGDEMTPPIVVRERPARTSRPFERRDDETLGEQVARRLEEGLAGNESVEDLFAELEGLLDEDDTDDDEDDDAAIDDGDLDPLVREFAWETELAPADVARLEGFVAVLRRAPVPRTTLESIDVDDLLRYLLQSWLATAPDRRVAELRHEHELLKRFYLWARDTQDYDDTRLVELADRAFVAHADRLDAAARELSGGDQPRGAPELFVVADVDLRGGVLLRLADDDRQVELRGVDHAAAALRPEDVVLGTFEPRSASFVGMAIVVPGALQHLLGS